MSGFGGVIAEVGRLGWIPARHHDPSTPVSDRTLVYGGLMERDETKDPLQKLRPEIDTPEDTLGDFQGAHLWQRNPNDRECSVWFYGPTPSMVVGTPKAPKKGTTGVRKPGGGNGGQLLPILDLDTPYTALQPRAPRVPGWASKFPGGWHGLGAATVEADRQVDTWHPDFLGVIAPSFGNAKYGTRVFDLGDSAQLDKDRWAYLQQAMCVLDFTQQAPCDFSGYGLALQLGGDKLEGKSGHALYADHDNGWIGSASKKHGGPFMLGPGCRHSQGPDSDGNDFRPVHLSNESLFLWPGVGDGPLEFDANPWEQPEADAPHWQQCYLRWKTDTGAGATVCGKRYNGAWSIESTSHLYVPDPPPEGEDGIGRVESGDYELVDPEAPEVPEAPVTGSEPPGRPVTGGTPGGSTGDQLATGGGPAVEFTPDGTIPPGPGLDANGDPTAGGNSEPPDQEIIDEAGNNYEGDEFSYTGVPGLFAPLEPLTEAVGTTGQAGVVDHGTGPLTPTVADAGTYRPAYPHTSACLAAPGFLLKGTAHALGAPDLTGASLVDSFTRDLWNNAPFVAGIQGFGCNPDGEWESFDTDQANAGTSYAMSSGGLTMLPAGVSLAKLQNGLAEGNTRDVYFTLPPSVGSGEVVLALAQPDPTTGAVNTGQVLRATATTLTATPVDSSGTEGTPVDLLSGGGGTVGVDDHEVSAGGNDRTATAGRYTYEEVLNEGDGQPLSNTTAIPQGSTITNVWIEVLTSFDSASTPGAFSVGISSDTNKWGQNISSDVGGKSSSADYQADPRMYVTGAGATDGFVDVTAAGFNTSNAGNGELLLVIEYEKTSALAS